MLFQLPPGSRLDDPLVGATPRIYRSFNMRSRLGKPETIGLFGPIRDVDGDHITLPGPDVYRTAFTTPSVTLGQVLFGSVSSIQLMQYDPNSTPATGTRWEVIDVTPPGFAGPSDLLPDPSTGKVEIPPNLWLSDQEDVVVGCRAGVTGEPCYFWNRQSAVPFAPLANSPTGAVGGGIINRILVLIGCTSFTDPNPQRYMTIRWSDRFNFEEWTPSDVNVSGELQVEGGSRLVGGGVTGLGVIAWTDKRTFLLTETFDPDSVFQRRGIDGGRGLMANAAWCETDGQVWWFDETRGLTVFDGGRPRRIENPLKYGSVERLNDRQIARSYLVPNPEYNEIILFYPSGNAENPDRALVYCIDDETWNIWRLDRPAWSQRYGVIHALGVDPQGKVFQHDLDVSLDTPYIPSPAFYGPDPKTVPAADITPYDFRFDTNLISAESATNESWKATRVMVDHLPMPAVGASDSFDVTVRGFGEPTLTALSASETQTYPSGGPPMDFRVAGKAIQLEIAGTQIKTLYRFGDIGITAAEDAPR